MRNSHADFSLRALCLCVAGFLLLHTASILLFPAHAQQLSALFLVVAPAIAALAALWCAFARPAAASLLWALLAIAFLIWTIASGMDCRVMFLFHEVVNTGTASQIVYFFYGIPILLAIATPAEDSWSPLALWLDGFQIAIVGLLTYIVIFSIIPFSHEVVHPASANVAITTFNIENLVLALAATLRFLASSQHPPQRHFHRVLLVFLWTYAVIVGVYNYVSIRQPISSLYDLLVDIPFLLLFFLALMPDRRQKSTPPKRFPVARSLAMLLDNGSPTLFPATVLALGISILPNHFHIGVTTIVLSMAIYGIRSTVLQFEYQNAQLDARRARDNMEHLSLTDPLTGIANRRQFDIQIHAEWKRLSKNRGPLSLLLIDIDYFKLLNDTFGHAEGDVTLRQVAHALQASLQREADVLTRYGGEEFAVILPGTDRVGAAALALRMRTTLASLRVRNQTPIGNRLTISLGASTCELPCNSRIDELFAAADVALYRAKQNGRNRFEFEPLESRASGAHKSLLPTP